MAECWELRTQTWTQPACPGDRGSTSPSLRKGRHLAKWPREQGQPHKPTALPGAPAPSGADPVPGLGQEKRGLGHVHTESLPAGAQGLRLTWRK